MKCSSIPTNWFGNSINFSNETEKSVIAHVTANVQAMRFWALQYAPYVTILKPQSLVEMVKKDLKYANAFLLINKLYQYNPQYFYNFLDALVDDTSMDYQFRLSMTMQVKSEDKKGSTIPDAMIVQNGYRLCFETKIGDWFYIEQDGYKT